MSSAALAGGAETGPPHLHPAFRLAQTPVARSGRWSGLPDAGAPARIFSFGTVLLLHALALFLLTHARVPLPGAPVTLMLASLIAPEPLPVAEIEPISERPKVEPAPLKPVTRPVPRRKEVAPSKLTAATDAPSAESAPVQETAPPEPVSPDAAPVATPAPAAVTAAPAAAVPPSEAPRFDAAYLSNPKPAYPMLSRRAGEEGRVMLRVMVEANGLPSKIDVEQSSGFPRLDEAALEAVRKWKFVPARRGTEAVAESVLVPLSFGLPR
jgi:protein TonB